MRGGIAQNPDQVGGSQCFQAKPAKKRKKKIPSRKEANKKRFHNIGKSNRVLGIERGAGRGDVDSSDAFETKPVHRGTMWGKPVGEKKAAKRDRTEKSKRIPTGTMGKGLHTPGRPET